MSALIAPSSQTLRLRHTEALEHLDQRLGTLRRDGEAGWPRPAARGPEEPQRRLGADDAAERLRRLVDLHHLAVDSRRAVAIAGVEALDERHAELRDEVPFGGEVPGGAERGGTERVHRTADVHVDPARHRVDDL